MASATMTMTYRELLSMVRNRPLDDASLDAQVLVAVVDDLGHIHVGRLAGPVDDLGRIRPMMGLPSIECMARESKARDVITSAGDASGDAAGDTIEDLATHWPPAVGPDPGPGFDLGEHTQIFNLRDVVGENPWVDAGDETKRMRSPSGQAKRALSGR